MKLLRVDNVNKRFGGAVSLHVLREINLELRHGEFASLIGPSGSGKTTLLNIIATLDAPTDGEVLILGLNVHNFPEAKLNQFRNRHLGFIFQDDLLLGHLTALENVMMPGRIARTPVAECRAKASELLDRVGLADRMKHLPGQLSGGQRQRVNLARALVNEPELLLADEPTARLDQPTGQEIVDLLIELNEQMGVTILMVTHERDVAAQAKRTIEILDGRIVSDRPNEPAEVHHAR